MTREVVVLQDALARAREAFLARAPFDAHVVRRPILDSWTRSAASVRPERVEPPRVSDLDGETPLARAGARVLSGVWDVLSGEAVSLVLCDGEGTVLERRTGDGALLRHLDRVSLAPGYSYAERHVGTNGIGTALQSGTAATVVGHEHFAEHLEHLACAAAPVTHPLTGAVAGVVNLTCRAPDAGALLLATVTSLAAQIRSALLDEAGRRERALLDAFLSACQVGADPVLAVSDDVVVLNRTAREALGAEQQRALLAALGSARSDVVLDLPDGTRAHVRCRTAGLGDGDAVLQVQLQPRSPAPPVQRRAAPPGLAVGPALAACWEAVQRAAPQDRLVLVGEPGSGRAALAHAAAAARLQEVDATDLPDVLPPGPLLVRDADRLPGPVLDVLLARPERLVLTTGPLPLPEALAGLPVVEVPPLRARASDLPALARVLLRRAAGHPVALDPAVGPLLAAHCWPGGVAELSRVLAACLPRSGPLTAAHLPDALQVPRRLTPLQQLEREAALVALARTRGDKAAAAAQLGTSRATLYRRVKTYGLEPLLPG